MEQVNLPPPLLVKRNAGIVVRLVASRVMMVVLNQEKVYTSLQRRTKRKTTLATPTLIPLLPLPIKQLCLLHHRLLQMLPNQGHQKFAQRMEKKKNTAANAVSSSGAPGKMLTPPLNTATVVISEQKKRRRV